MTSERVFFDRLLVFGAIAAFAGTALSARPAFADPLDANAGMILRMAQNASFQEGCFAPCMCPITVEQPIIGTLKLVYSSFSDGEHSYAVEDVNWLVGSNAAHRIVGRGKYRIGTPEPLTVIQHRLELDLRVGDSTSAHYDSGWIPRSNSSEIDISVSINGMFCWDRVIRVHAIPIASYEYERYSLDAGSTFLRGCIDGLCDCAVGPELPMVGDFALVPLYANSPTQLFSVVDVRWWAISANTTGGIPISGAGFYWAGGEVPAQNRLSLDLKVANEEPQRYDSGMTPAGVPFPLIDIETRTHTNCVDTLLHVVASPAGGGEICGGIMGLPCSEGEFCKLAPGECCCDFQGVCTPIPQACPEHVDLVCGCDGVTYNNPCFAETAGQSIDYWGRCRTLCGPDAQSCPNNDEFCKFPTGSCGTGGHPGLCTSQPGGCPDVWDPVCGCNGITYGNECEADAARESLRHVGICEDPCRPTPDGLGCTSCFSDVPEDVCRASVLHLDIHGGAITTLDCDCMNMSACHILFGNASPFAEGNCPNGQSCEVVRRDSDNDGIDDTFWARCMSSQVGPCCFDIDDGPVRYDTCLPRSEADCEAEGGIFAGTNTGCETTQPCCLPNIDLCVDLHPICCLASGGQPGTPGTSCGSGGCGVVCGGIAGIPCADATDFCKLPIGHCCCDHFGMCVPTGASCPAQWDPVCGCDGMTYSNECEADAAGVSIDHRGECGQPTCPATRFLTHPNSHPCADSSNLVRIILTPPNSASAVALEESLPQGWTAHSISHAGQYDAVNHKVKWGPFFPPFPSELSYYVSRTNNANSVPCFGGSVSVDGINESTCGESCLEDCCPHMIADQPQDACGNCPVTDCNSCDASVCEDSRIHMCEIVGYACAWLHGCHDDLSGMTRAAYIWRTGECYCWDEAANNWQPGDCTNTPPDGCCRHAAQTWQIIGGSPATLSTSEEARGSKDRAGLRRYWVDLEVPTTTIALALEIEVPKGWSVSGISDGGVWDPASRNIRWGVFFEDHSRTVTFTAAGPSKKSAIKRNGLSNLALPGQWRGTLSVDGLNYPVTLEP